MNECEIDKCGQREKTQRNRGIKDAFGDEFYHFM